MSSKLTTKETTDSDIIDHNHTPAKRVMVAREGRENQSMLISLFFLLLLLDYIL